MPQGRRKVPFSAKQKKMQLQNKRKRKVGLLGVGEFMSSETFEIYNDKLLSCVFVS